MTSRPTALRDEADSMGDLVADCRELAGALGAQAPAARPVDHRGALPVDITDDAVRRLTGYDVYGS